MRGDELMKIFVMSFLMLFSANVFAKDNVYNCTANQNPKALDLTVQGNTSVTIKSMGKAVTTKIVTQIDPQLSQYYGQKITENGIDQDKHIEFYFADDTPYPEDIVVNLDKPEKSFLLVPEDQVTMTCKLKN